MLLQEAGTFPHGGLEGTTIEALLHMQEEL